MAGSPGTFPRRAWARHGAPRLALRPCRETRVAWDGGTPAGYEDKACQERYPQDEAVAALVHAG
ncbi:MAG: hypothetical protein NVSMB65_17270 [Chloroflexota bacterium]